MANHRVVTDKSYTKDDWSVLQLHLIQPRGVWDHANIVENLRMLVVALMFASLMQLRGLSFRSPQKCHKRRFSVVADVCCLRYVFQFPSKTTG